MSEQGVGAQWLRVFKQQGNLYAHPQASRASFEKFRRGPYVQLMLRYAGLAAGAQVIEVGCGSGRFTACLASLGYRATALDISHEMAGNARNLARQAEQYFGPLAVAVVQADMDATLPLASSGYDLVFNEGVVEHWLDDTERQRVLNEMARITRPGGVMAVIVPNGGHPWMPAWVRHNPACLSAPPMTMYSTDRLRRDLEQAGLAQVATDGIYPWHSLDWGRPGRLRALAGGALSRAIPLPRGVRERWGVMIVGMGRKPDSPVL